MHTQAVKPALGAELALQVSHAFVVLPAAENVPAAHAATTASDVGVHGVTTRWPGPAAAQAWQVGSVEPGLVAKKAPAHTQEERLLDETECGSVQLAQLAADCAE